MTLRRVMVSAEPAGAGSWSVTVRLSDGQLLPARSMSGVDGLPQPRPGSALATDAGDVTAVRTVYDRLLARDPWGDDVADFGAYLFDVLLRDDWDEVVHACGSDGIELALRWDAGEQGLSRLPWELMHGPSGFLVADPDRSIGITRLVRGADAAFDDLPGELRVLFVIGTDRREPSIRPGAEYHMLLRRLNARGISFTSHVLARANRQSLTDELERWRPPVVHFICHGRFMDSQAALELTAEDDPRGRELLDGRQLADIMRAPGRPLPQIVVLNACQSGVSVGPTRPRLNRLPHLTSSCRPSTMR